jgi:hypothetical protein
MFLLLMAVVITAGAVDLDREGRDPAYVESIVKRSQKIVDKLELTDTVAAREVTTIIANRYFKLNDIYETRDTKVKLAKETLTGNKKPLKLPKLKRMRHFTALISLSRPIFRFIWMPSR